MTGCLLKGTLSDCWTEGLKLLFEHGQYVQDQRGRETLELIGLQTVIPYKAKIPEKFTFKESALKQYKEQLLSPDNDGFAYTYGNRLFAWDGCTNQIKAIIHQLQDSRESRRAIASTWIPAYDHFVEEVPCMMVAQFLLREDDLSLLVYFRSHDFYGAYPANVFGLTGLLEYVAKPLLARPKEIVTISASAHTYDTDWQAIEKIIDMKPHEKAVRLEAHPREGKINLFGGLFP